MIDKEQRRQNDRQQSRTAYRPATTQSGHLRFRYGRGKLGHVPGEKFIITSDRVVGELPNNRVPQITPLEVFQVWKGEGWSATITDATFFAAIDVADECIRANYARVMA